MTINTNTDMRFMSNNYLKTGYNTFTMTSIAANYLIGNMIDEQRTKVSKFGGRFLIDSTNNKVYINGTTYTIASFDYQTPALFAAAVSTAISASGVSCSYSAITLKFTLSKGSSFTLNLSSTANAAWNTLGIYTATDLTGILTTSSEVTRIHWPYEKINIDFGYQAELGFVGIISDLSTDLKIPENATVTFKANTINSFGSPIINEVLLWREKGMFKFFDEYATSTCRYVEITIECPEGPIQPEIGYLYIGDSTQFSGRNISNGIEVKLEDSSILSTSENGQLYANKKVPVRVIDAMKVGLVTPDNVSFIKNLFYLKQITTPFFVALDPKEVISNGDEYTLFCRFNSEPRIKHIINNIYEIEFNIKEAM